ncbi:hypothetical protein Q5741_21420, partial [Paenibacillus sp. JX-17]
WTHNCTGGNLGGPRGRSGGGVNGSLRAMPGGNRFTVKSGQSSFSTGSSSYKYKLSTPPTASDIRSWAKYRGKGAGNALVKDTGKLADNTANLRSWAEGKGWVRQDTAGGVEQWGVKNADGTFSWRLKLKPEASTREGLGAGSNQPRFDARLDDKGTYINPFTGQTGGRDVGTHIPLGK